MISRLIEMILKIIGIFWIATAILSHNLFAFVSFAKISDGEGADNLTIARSLTMSYDPGAEQLQENIYLVIGVFALKSNAKKFSEYATKNGFPAQFSLNEDNNFYYVYLHSSADWEELKLRHQEVV